MQNKVDDLTLITNEIDSNLGGVGNKLRSNEMGARNVIVANLANFSGFLIGFFLTPILLFHLGAAQFGAWNLLLNALGYIGLLQCGLNVALPQQIAEAVGLEDQQRLKKIFGTALFVYLIYALCSLLIVITLAFTFQRFLNIPKSLIPSSRLCLLILGFNQFIGVIFVVRDSILYGTGRMYITSGFSIFFNTINTFIQISFVLNGWGIVGMAYSQVVISALNVIVYSRLLGKNWTGTGIAISTKNASKAVAIKLFSTGFRSFLISLSGTLSSGSNVLIIGTMLPIKYVAYYAISSKLILMINSLSTKISDVSLPVYSQAQSTGDFKRIFKIYTENVSLSLAICLPFTLACIVYGERIITSWVGRGYEEAYPILAIEALLFFFLVPGGASIALLNGTDRSRLISKIYPLAAVFNFLISVVLTYFIGAPGVVLGSLIVGLIVDFQVLPWLVCREFNFPLSNFWLIVARPLIAPFISASGSILLIGLLHIPPTRFFTLLSVLFIMLPAWAIWFMTGLQVDRRNQYLRSLKGAFKRV